MGASMGPVNGLIRAEKNELEQAPECKNCGAPGVYLAHKCAYCDSVTAHGARQARLQRLQMNSFNAAYGSNVYNNMAMSPHRSKQ